MYEVIAKKFGSQGMFHSYAAAAREVTRLAAGGLESRILCHVDLDTDTDHLVVYPEYGGDANS